MAQNDRALFLYGFDITTGNQYINFKTSAMGAVKTAIIPIGNYTCTELLFQVKKQMQLADGVNVYTVSVNRTVPNVKSNQVTISTNGAYLSILFGTGPNASNSVSTLIGFPTSDLTGSTSYTSGSPAGIILVPDFPMWDYLSPDNFVTNDMNKNVSAAGIKETLVFAQVLFTQAQWKYITNFNGTQLTEWQAFMKYTVRQLKFEFTPSIYEDATKFYPVTLEKTSSGADGGAYKLNLMNKDGLYRFFETGVLDFRVIPPIS